MTGGFLGLVSRPETWLAGLSVAGFLALFWWLRGAPVGQSVKEPDVASGPVPRRRDVWVALAALGVVLVAAGAYVAPVYGIPASLPVFAMAVVTIQAAARGAKPYRHSSPVCLRVVRFSETALTAAMLTGILVVGNVAAFRYGDRPFDLTRDRVHTLEPETIVQLQGLKQPLRLTAFYYSRLPQPALSRQILLQMDRVTQLLELMQAENAGKVSVDVVDFSDPKQIVAARDLEERAPDAAVSTGGVLVELGTGKDVRRLVVSTNEMFPTPPGSLQEADMTSFRGEYTLTTAIIRLKQNKKFRIAMITGHGEPSLDELDARRPGLGLLKSRLSDVGFDVLDVNLSTMEVPKDVSMAMVVAPRTAFSAGEAGRLKEYMAGGGRLIVMINAREKTGLEELLHNHNIEMKTAIVLEKLRMMAAPNASVMVEVPRNATHPVLKPLGGQMVMFPLASPLVVLDPQTAKGSPPDPKLAAEPLLKTGPNAWGETNLSGAGASMEFDPSVDEPGPITVAATVCETGRRGMPDHSKPRLVVFSSPDMASNPFVSQVGYEANLNLVVDAANWLRGELETPTIAPRTRTIARLDPDPAVQNKLLILPTLMALLLIVVPGVMVFLIRRS
ncbi:MAG TPA: GldG family protein [Isosphaeraceae bacterium]|nr:GldG family protein [Isosphaeraceae bacterium]